MSRAWTTPTLHLLSVGLDTAAEAGSGSDYQSQTGETKAPVLG